VRVFLQAQDESIIINGDITLTVLKIEGGEVVLGIDAPQWLAIEERPELQFELRQQNSWVNFGSGSSPSV
jgi:carbon storage regulator CsrA